MSKTDAVVLLHGIVKSSADMWLASRFLERQGYRTFNPSYSTSLGNIDEIAAHVWEKIRAEKLDHPDVRLHFVAHSLGGLVTDSIIRNYKPASLERVVMWGTPLQGCAYADRLNDSKMFGALYRFLYGAAGQDVQVRSVNPARDTPLNYSAGMIAGTSSINPMANMFLHDLGDHDGIVPVSSTQRPGLADYLTLPISHTGLLFSGEVHRQTAHFLKSGRFSHATS